MFKRLRFLIHYCFFSIIYFWGLLQEKLLYLSFLIKNKSLFKKRKKHTKEEIEEFRELLKKLCEEDKIKNKN